MPTGERARWLEGAHAYLREKLKDERNTLTAQWGRAQRLAERVRSLPAAQVEASLPTFFEWQKALARAPRGKAPGDDQLVPELV
eukprot:611358-Lingulodinium_polyedra.AAC.1